MEILQDRNNEIELKYQLLKLRFDLKNGKLIDSSLIKKNRKLVAKLLTGKGKKNEKI